MPTQEDRVVVRMKVLTAYIKDKKDWVSWKEIENWCFVMLGIRPKTSSLYLLSLEAMGIIETDGHTENNKVRYLNGAKIEKI